MTANKRLFTFLLAFSLAAYHFGVWAQDLPQNPLKGRELFTSKGCIKCHAIRGEGGKVGPDLGKTVGQRSFFEVASIMWNHSPVMSEKMRELKVPRPKFSAEEMADMLAFLYFLNYFEEPGNPAQGKAIFARKGCFKCHAVGGVGGREGPSLDELKRYVSPIMVAQAMWNHAPQMTKRMKELGITRPTLERNEIVDLIAYLQQAANGTSRERVYAIPGSPAEGEKLFSAKGCVRCHSVRGKGGKVGPDLAQSQLSLSATQVAGVMWNHAGQMEKTMQGREISWPQFSGKEMADLVSYLYFINFYGPRADAGKGKRLFSAKGCVTCHSIRGQGGKVGPDLARSEAVASPVATAQAMWNHAPLMEQRMGPSKVSWPRFDKNEMADLLAYLVSVKEAKPSPAKDK